MSKVVVVGLGYIGLPTAALIASNNVEVHGVDVKEEVVDIINRGEIHIVEPELDVAVKNAVDNGYLKASTQAIECDVYLIVVPTPFKGNHEPDISYVESATKGILPLLKEGDLYIIESTSPIGTTEKMQELILSARPELEGKVNMAYCPERVLPGNVMHELVYNDRVIGGIDDQSTERAMAFYSEFVKGDLHPTNARTAEMCKLVENASRDVQIAFANELSIICDKADINVWELINLANKHPRVNILRPGSGVGGHCIAVDPYFITSHFPLESKIIGVGREINNYKAFWCVEKVQKEVTRFEKKHGRKPVVGMLGLAFKPNIDDLRESPALHITEKIYQTHPKNLILIAEPNIEDHNEFPITNYKDVYVKAEILVYLVAHKEFIGSTDESSATILDFCGVLDV